MNDFKIDGDIVIIYCENSKKEIIETKVSLKTYNDKLKHTGIRWYASWQKDIDNYYILYTKHFGSKNGKQIMKTILLHRYITDAKKGEYIDHKNRDPLDNTDDNLRKTSNLDNNKNRKSKNKNNTSGYRNVSFDGKGNPIVQLQDKNGKCLKWSGFTDVHEAGIFAEQKRKELYGEFAGES